MREVFIIGSKGIPASYGGFETFVDNLVKHKADDGIQYHVACMADANGEHTYHGAHCFDIKVPNIGPAKAVLYDILAFRYCLHYIEKHSCEAPVVYVLACRIGPFIKCFKRSLKRLHGKYFVNPDGHEWKRAKWNAAIKRYWKFSERLMIKHADLVICDSKHIESYVKKEYKTYHPSTTYIAYGADVPQVSNAEPSGELLAWYEKHGLCKNGYYLIVGRFVPENNYKLMFTEFMRAKTAHDLVIITNVEKNKFYKRLQDETQFADDKRIKFVGTVYDQALLSEIRSNALAYLHGHAVGGTNPSLLEALATTPVNLLYKVGFNREVAEDAALYFTREEGDLAKKIDEIELFDEAERDALHQKAKKRIREAYAHALITEAYEKLFSGC